MKRLAALLIMVFALALPRLSEAGSSQGAPNDLLPAEDVAAFALSVEEGLAKRGAYVAIVARTGRDPSDLPSGIRYTHVAYWVYSKIRHADGRTSKGYRVYNLYQRFDDPTRSELVQDSPVDFFSSAHVLDAGIIVPKPALQKKLMAMIKSPGYARLHNPNYALVANPASRMFQNCTEHTLNVLVGSLYSTSNPARVKSNIAAYFEPQRVDVGRIKRMIAPALSGAMTTADHGRVVRTATFTTIAGFMERYDLADAVFDMTAPVVRPL